MGVMRILTEPFQEKRPMPNLRMLFWNIENLGNENGSRSRAPRLYFLAQAIQRYGADVSSVR